MLNKKVIKLLQASDITLERKKILLALKSQIILLDLRAMLYLCDDIVENGINEVQTSFYDEIVELETAI